MLISDRVFLSLMNALGNVNVDESAVIDLRDPRSTITDIQPQRYCSVARKLTYLTIVGNSTKITIPDHLNRESTTELYEYYCVRLPTGNRFVVEVPLGCSLIIWDDNYL